MNLDVKLQLPMKNSYVIQHTAILVNMIGYHNDQKDKTSKMIGKIGKQKTSTCELFIEKILMIFNIIIVANSNTNYLISNVYMLYIHHTYCIYLISTKSSRIGFCSSTGGIKNTSHVTDNFPV